MFLAEMETVRFDPANNEYSTTECVICMESFNPNEQISRIPICRHFFHAQCINQWFERNMAEDEQRCPQCNATLKTKQMRDMKIENDYKDPGQANPSEIKLEQNMYGV